MLKHKKPATPARAPKGQSGYSLIEVLIAIALLSFILLGVAQLFIWTTKQNLSADDLTRCAALANERVEELRANRDFSAFTLADPTYTDSIVEANLTLDTGEHEYNFERTTTVTQIVQGTTPVDLFHVSVEVVAIHEGARTMYMTKDNGGRNEGRRVQIEVLLSE